MNRAERQLFEIAADRAAANGLELRTVDPDDRQYRLERTVNGRLIWSVDLWPTLFDRSRVAWRDGFKGPVLPLPNSWTVLDAVDAMIQMIAEENKKKV